MREAGLREMKEELGIDFLKHGSFPEQPNKVISSPKDDSNQTVSMRFVVSATVKELPILNYQTDDVVSCKWLTYGAFDCITMAFNHIELIEWGRNYVEKWQAAD